MNIQPPKTHKLKTLSEYFQKVWDGNKTFEIRINDRDFKVGETVLLYEFNQEKNDYTGRYCEVKITYIFAGGKYGLADGYVCFSFSVLKTVNYKSK